MAYDKARATAKRLITQFGASLTLVRTGEGDVYDPITGTMSGGADVNLTGVGVLLNYKKAEIENDILTTDKKLIWSGDVLAVGDKLNGSRVYSFSNLDPDGSGSIITIAQIRI